MIKYDAHDWACIFYQCWVNSRVHVKNKWPKGMYDVYENFMEIALAQHGVDAQVIAEQLKDEKYNEGFIDPAMTKDKIQEFGDLINQLARVMGMQVEEVLDLIVNIGLSEEDASSIKEYCKDDI